MNQAEFSPFKNVAPLFVELIDEMGKRDSMLPVLDNVKQCVFALYACDPSAYKRGNRGMNHNLYWEHVRLYLEFARDLEYSTHEFLECGTKDEMQCVSLVVRVPIWPLVVRAFQEVMILPPTQKLCPEKLFRKLSGQHKNMPGPALAYSLTEFLKALKQNGPKTSLRP